MLVSLNELAITVGILISFLVNYIFATVPGGWRIMFGLSSVVAVLQGLAMLFLPKTPQFLMISRQEEKAEQTLRRLQITRNVRQTMTNIRLALAEESSQSFVRVLCDNSDNIGSRLFIGFGLVFFQQFTGQPNIIYYASDIFKQVGFCSEMSSTLASVGLGSMKVASTAVSLVLVDRIGRRKALVSGISVMTVSVLILTAFAFYQLHVDGHMHQETCSELDAFKAETNLKVNSVREHLFIPDSEHNSTGEMDFTLINATATGDCPVSKIPPGFRYLAFAALIGYVCAYSFSFGPIVWVLLSEIFPAALKGRAMALATAGNWLGNVVVSATFIQATGAFKLNLNVGVSFGMFIRDVISW